MIMKNKLVNTLLVLVAAVIAPLALVYATTYGATSRPENQAFAYFNQGVEHMEQGEWQLALEDLSDAIESDQENPETRHLRGYVYTELGR